MPQLLLELLSEEIPARMQARAAELLHEKLMEIFDTAGFVADIAGDDYEVFVTPRRLTVVVDNVPRKQPDRTIERRGPRVGAPAQAIQGFLKANGLKSAKQAEQRETDKGDFYFAVKQVKGRLTKDLLIEKIPGLIYDFNWPKSMRWANTAVRWVRPLHGILCVFDGRAVRFPVSLASTTEDPPIEIASGNTTVGHRFLAPKPFKVRDFADYEAKLKKAKVMLDAAARRDEILKQAKRRIARVKPKLKLKADPDLIDEISGLVEWPVVLMGRIEDRFMDLPPEVLTTSMRTHQKYIALHTARGRLANRFLLVANMETADRGKAIVAGNERVLRARLADAQFFWDRDRRVSLASRTTRLRDIVFHEKLGTLDEKVDRVQALATEIADYVPGAEKDRVRSAARLAKADLVTGMVGEFPELQGVMGRYYALHDGEHKDVARAIAEHYAPLGPGDKCPSAPVSVAVALADKLDTLIGLFAVGERPTGSKDPYALRRAALGILRLIIENRLRLPLIKALELAASAAPVAAREGRRRVVSELLDFFADRLKVALRDKGVRHDLIAAVFAVGGEDDFVRLLARVDALGEFLKSDDGANLLIAYRRAANIVRIEEKNDRVTYDGAVDPTLFGQDEERRLFKALVAVAADAQSALAKENFRGAMAVLATLRGPVDDFFERVTVNTDDPRRRANRLCLLSRARATLDRVADFSKIEG